MAYSTAAAATRIWYQCACSDNYYWRAGLFYASETAKSGGHDGIFCWNWMGGGAGDDCPRILHSSWKPAASA